MEKLNTGLFEGCASLTNIKLPASVTEFKDDCFKGCSSLTSFVIPVTVKEIGNSCFKNCKSLQNIELGASLSSIGGDAFANCGALTTVKCNASVPAKMAKLQKPFDKDSYNKVTLIVPTGTKNLYVIDKKWSKFRVIYEVQELQTTQPAAAAVAN